MNKNKQFKLLYLPNENNIGDQVGPRDVFNQLKKEGVLSDYYAYSFKFESKSKPDFEVVRHVKELVNDFQPDIILWQHVGDFKIDNSFIKDIKNIQSKPTLVYQDGDVYGRFIKRVPASMKILLKHSDITFAVGLGRYEKLLRKYGSKNVKYSPNFVDTIRFGKEWIPSLKRDYDVVMIGNNVHSKFPFFNMPGTKERQIIADMLYACLGERFAVYGKGWGDKKYNKGPIEFHKQEDVMRNSWISVGWNHFHDIPYYFSNRLPISLLSGVLHVTNFHNGYEEIFPNDTLVNIKDMNTCTEVIMELLEKDKIELIDMGRKGYELAKEKFTADVVMRNMMSEIINYRIKLQKD